MTIHINDWKDALAKLEEGNERFIAGLRSAHTLMGHAHLKDLAQNGQKPYAIVLCCSDSRVPAELLFDCGFGELFVVRVAGNVVQPSQIASIEYAAKVLGAQLCIVMGHTKCGAVQAAIDSEKNPSTDLGPNIAFLIELIRPSVQKVISSKTHFQSILDECIVENASNTAIKILENSSILRTLASEDKFKVVEAIFHLESGRVEFETQKRDKPHTLPSRKII